MGRLFFFLIIVYTIIYSLLNPTSTNTVVLETLSLWFLIVLPSILPMYLLSHVLIRMSFFTKMLYPLLKPILHFENETSCAIYIVSILAGNPTATSLIVSASEKNLISTAEANRMIKFCSFVSPLFIIGFSNKLYPGLSLFFILSQILASIIIGNFLPHQSHKQNNQEHAITLEAISDILSNAPTVLLNIGVTMVIVNIIKEPLLYIINSLPIKTIIFHFLLSLLEISTGLNDIIKANLPLTTSIFLFSTLFSLSGAAIHLQVITIISKKNVSYAYFLIFRLINMIIANIIIMFILLRLTYLLLVIIGLLLVLNIISKKKVPLKTKVSLEPKVYLETKVSLEN